MLTDDLEEVTATVTAIEPQQRLVSIETDDGRELTVEAGDDVRNFDQIEVGDKVEVAFYEALIAEVTDAPVSGGDEPVIVSTRRAPLGDRPAGEVALVYTVRPGDRVELTYGEAMADAVTPATDREAVPRVPSRPEA